jgi:hypothetical protein
LRVVKLEHAEVAGAARDVDLVHAPVTRLGRVGELEVERRATAHRRRARRGTTTARRSAWGR